MFRDTTYNDVSRLDAGEAGAELMMDEDAFRGFYDRTARGVWAYLARVTGDRQLADDLLQETYYRFLRAAAGHTTEAHRRNSLYRIATNLARDSHRRSLLRGTAVEDVERLASPHGDAEAERSVEFNRAMARLNPRERALLWLAYAEGSSHVEIAGILGVRAASLKPLLFRARRKLASLLGRGPEGAGQ